MHIFLLNKSIYFQTLLSILLSQFLRYNLYIDSYTFALLFYVLSNYLNHLLQLIFYKYDEVNDWLLFYLTLILLDNSDKVELLLPYLEHYQSFPLSISFDLYLRYDHNALSKATK